MTAGDEDGEGDEDDSSYRWADPNLVFTYFRKHGSQLWTYIPKGSTTPITVVKLTGTIIWYEADYTFTYSDGSVVKVPSHGLEAWNVTGNIITMYGENNMSFGGLPLFPAHLKAGTYELCSWYNREYYPGHTVRIWTNVTLSIFTRKGHGEPIDYIDADYTATPLGCMIHYEWYQNSGIATYVYYSSPAYPGAYSEFTLTGMIMPL